MKIEKKYLAKFLILLFSALLFFGAAKETDDKSKSQRLGKISATNPLAVESYFMYINKWEMPMDSRGVFGAVKVGDNLEAGRIDGKSVLYSGGFMMSGVNQDGIMWSNGVASASSITDYVAGNSMVDPDDSEAITHDDTYAGIFVVNENDEHFGDSWVAWGEAVNGGAKFYDGDGDGVYNPVDLNGNGVWDPDEDMPDLLGSETAWCVYTDALPANQRTFNDVTPQGIEVRQTVWAYATAGDLGNIMFIRYSLLNTGLVSEVHDSVYFGVWADPDLGEYTDDLVGSDTTLNAGYTYNDGPDDDFGVDPPCFLIDFFQGPWEVSEDPTDFAINTQGPILGVDTIWGNNNVGLTSFVQYIQGHPTQGDPDDEFEARYYLNGFNQQGDALDPCNWEFGLVYKEDCSAVDNRYMYSGDPVSLTGWIHVGPDDQRQMSNSGPFTLFKDQPVDVVVAYVVGRSTSAIASVKEAKKIDRAAQFVFQNNFNVPPPPPVIEPIIKAADTSIELIWETAASTEYSAVGVGFDMRFEFYEVKMYQSNVASNMNDGRQNSAVIARYDIQNEINSLLYEDPVNDERIIIYPYGGVQLDSTTYFDQDKGRISLVVTRDPFTNGPLVKGRPYFFSITSTAVNVDEIELFDALGTWLIPKTATLGTISNVPTILNDDYGNQGILTGEEQNEPYYAGVPAEHTVGSSTSEVSYSVQDKSKITTSEFEVGFFKDSLSIPYELYFYVKNTNTDSIYVDSSKNYEFALNDFNGDAFDPDAYYRDQINNLVDGVSVTIPWVNPGVGGTEFSGGTPWYTEDIEDTLTGAFYVGRDITDRVIWLPITAKLSNSITVDKTKRVELRFGETSKAFRYVRDPNRFVWNGNKTSDLDSGFVEVPFQAWVKSESEEYQLAVGFTETDGLGDSLGMPDAKYYPGGDISTSKEYILIFDALYSDDINANLVYSNNLKIGKADLSNGSRSADASFNDSLKAIAKSPWFNSMYVCGFETDQPRDNFSPTGTFTITPGDYLTPDDKYHYTAQVEMTTEDSKSNWDKVNVFPNPLFGINENVSYTGGRYDEPYVTFNNLPNDVTITIYSLSGVLLRTLEKSDASSILRWDLENEDGLRVASGMYIALIKNPEFGDKVLKLAVIMPQKQIQRY